MMAEKSPHILLTNYKQKALDERIRNDKRKPGVRLELSKRDVDMDLMRLISDGAISFEDLDGFSEELIERVKSLYKTFCN